MRTLFLPPTQDSAESGRLILRDGSTAFIRLSEPGDCDALRELFHRLSPESKRRPFFSTADPAETLLARQSDSSDPRSQLTLIVSRIVGGTSRIIATGSYAARDEATAEVAFAVDDEFQGKGLGGLLLERLALLAARHGFVRCPPARLPPGRGGTRYRGARSQSDLRGTSRRRLSHRRLAYPGGAPSEGTGCPVHYGVVSGCPEIGGRLHPGRESDLRRRVS